MNKISKNTIAMYLLILLPFSLFSNGVSFVPASLESSYSGGFNNTITMGEIEFDFGILYGRVSMIRLFDYNNAIVFGENGGVAPVIGFYSGGSSFLPLNLGCKPNDKLSLDLGIDFFEYPSQIQGGRTIRYYLGNGSNANYRIFGIPAIYVVDLNINYRLFENNNFAIKWNSGIRMYGFPPLSNPTIRRLESQETILDILSNPNSLEIGNHKKNIFLPHTGIKLIGPSLESGSKIPSRVITYTIASGLHGLSTLNLGYSNESLSGRIKYIVTDCAMGTATGALEQFLHETWVNEDDSHGSKLGKKFLIRLIGGLIWEAGTTTAWATNIASGGGGSDYMVRDILFFGSLQAGLAFHIGFSANFEK